MEADIVEEYLLAGLHLLDGIDGIVATDIGNEAYLLPEEARESVAVTLHASKVVLAWSRLVPHDHYLGV